MSDTAIVANGLSKRYRLGSSAHHYGRLTESLSNAFAAPFRVLSHRAVGTPKEDYLWALRDVSFEIKVGQAVGLIGRNGAGKTTLLKLLARITEPSEGRAVLHGRVASLLEVGTGFHPELTGRENVYLNGAILGMSRAEINRRFDEIVDFSEVGRFLDTPVKRYSSGMQVRLAFAVAAHLEPEILLVDEVLAVGDVAFQRKCLGKMSNVASEGRTVVFVSHNMAAITNLCTRAYWIDAGSLAVDGTPAWAVAQYLSSSVSEGATWSADASGNDGREMSLLAAEVRDGSGNSTAAVRFDQPFVFDVSYRVNEQIQDAVILLRITDLSGNIVFTSWDIDSGLIESPNRMPGAYVSSCTVPKTLLKPGRYWLSVGCHVPNGKPLDYRENVVAFDVMPVEGGLNSDRLGVVSPVLEWKTLKLS
jgi:lipopolysaccharide transport system ATP-binding protein